LFQITDYLKTFSRVININFSQKKKRVEISGNINRFLITYLYVLLSRNLSHIEKLLFDNLISHNNLRPLCDTESHQHNKDFDKRLNSYQLSCLSVNLINPTQ
jgi:hypothetical protein